MLTEGMQKTAEETALMSPPEVGTRAFLWTFDSLDEDHELERFFSGLPSFRASKMVRDPLPDLTRVQKTSQIRRTVICTKSIDLVDIPKAGRRVLNGIVSEDCYGPVQSAEIARLVRGWDNGNDEETSTVIQAVVSSIVARTQRRDDLWFAIASDELGVPESVLRNHATHGDSLSLVLLIHISRQQFSQFWKLYWPWRQFSTVLEAASKFDVLDTSPELQHEFCALWNQIVRKVQEDDDRSLAYFALGLIRNVYVALHERTDSTLTLSSASTSDGEDILYDPSTYPLCNISAHHPDSTPYIHDVSAFTTTSHLVLLDNAAPVPIYHARTPDSASLSIPAPVHASEIPIYVPPLDDDISVTAPFHHAHWEATGCLRDSETSLDPACASAAQEIETSTRSIPPTTIDTSTSPSSLPSTGAVSIQNNSELANSDAPVVPSSTALELEPGLDNILPTVLRLSIAASASLCACPRPPSAPELDTVTSDEGTGSHEDKDALDPPSVNHTIRANTMATLDHPTPVTDMAIAGLSWRESDAGHTGDHLSQTSQGQYDIV
ncbi:hypothetical protein EI94DRAFT_1818439 [Lactarius quietus]|nr:hypothetical protein EI94DRAFT_1818439 [Lactarius quietus]